jgi:hypothetical protein
VAKYLSGRDLAVFEALLAPDARRAADLTVADTREFIGKFLVPFCRKGGPSFRSEEAFVRVEGFEK